MKNKAQKKKDIKGPHKNAIAQNAHPDLSVDEKEQSGVIPNRDLKKNLGCG